MAELSEVRSRISLEDGLSVTVRGLRAGDESKLKAFFESLSPESLCYFLPHPYTEESLRRRIERAESGEDLVYLGLDGETAAGYFFLWNIQGRVPLLGIGVANAYQNHSLGRQFMTILIEDAKRLGKDGIELTTMQDNDRAFHVYRKVGFEYIGDVENVAGDGRVVIERAMFLPLKEGAGPMRGEHRCPD
jgi:ribosomal protein S18 acetylase RimI-like enzyme